MKGELSLIDCFDPMGFPSLDLTVSMVGTICYFPWLLGWPSKASVHLALYFYTIFQTGL